MHQNIKNILENILTKGLKKKKDTSVPFIYENYTLSVDFMFN